MIGHPECPKPVGPCDYPDCSCQIDDEPDEDLRTGETIEEMNRAESRYIDRQNARDINRRVG